ncbi:MAG: hypothetical protein GY771_03355 [bacterium]|nr:hypothetical protein [bacterium]
MEIIGLHRLIEQKCLPLFEQGLYFDASLMAFMLVENELRRKSLAYPIVFGSDLIDFAFKTQGVKLIHPSNKMGGDELRQFFISTFNYYMGILKKEPLKINEALCRRMFHISSELLSIIDTSERMGINAGLVIQLVADGYFANKQQLIDLIQLLHGYVIVGNTYAGLIETLREEGFTVNQFEFLFEADLIGIRISSIYDNIPASAGNLNGRQMMVLCLTDEGLSFAQDELGVEMRKFD